MTIPMTSGRRRLTTLATLAAVAGRLAAPCVGSAASITYDATDALLAKHCLECHGAKDPEGGLVMESHAGLLKGGESGPAIVPGKSSESLLILAVEGRWEKEGKKKIMPPGKRAKLDASEIATLKEWIAAGAPSTLSGKPRELVVPNVPPQSPARNAIQSLALSASNATLAVARYAEVELRSTATRETLRSLRGHRGNVNGVAFSKDGQILASVAGQPGLAGELFVWKSSDGSLIRKIDAHRDAIYSVDISPDGKLVATGSYDQEIMVWSLSDGSLIRSLHGHNGAVFDLAFRPDGKVLASASGDRTVKLWEVATGRRLDTLSQSTKDVYTLAWSRDGARLFAAGVDNRIRVWSVSATAQETTNPLLESRFAHEGSILRLVISLDGRSLASSAEDRTVKIWDAASLQEKAAFPSQPDLAPGLAFFKSGDDAFLAVGRLDGSTEHYKLTQPPSQAVTPPELLRLSPQGVRRGVASTLKAQGKNLAAAELRSGDPRLKARWRDSGSDSERTLEVAPAADMRRGTYTLTAAGPGGASKAVELWVDDIEQRFDDEASPGSDGKPAQLPVAWWATLRKPGDKRRFVFEARAGELLVLDLAAKSASSRLNARMELFGPDGLLVATGAPLEPGDPLIVYRVSSSGPHRVEVQDETLAGSADHFFRMSLGAFPFVVGAFPPSIPVGEARSVAWIGYNLPADAASMVKASEPGRIDVPLDPERCRFRSAPQLVAIERSGVLESEPNDAPGQALDVPVPGEAIGRLWRTDSASDVDHFGFHAKAGEILIIETYAAQQGSPADTKLEVLFPDGRPVPRALLQARRNTAINFRSVDAIGSGMRLDHYEEMELNELLYLGGDVMKFFRMPQGPDSDMVMYTRHGKRRAYLDTTSTGHALDEAGFIVTEHPPNATPANNGLPTFLLSYANDDDGDRALGTDSRLFFTAPADGRYVVRISEALGRGGERFSYRLLVRPPHPDFQVTLDGTNPAVPPGIGRMFTLKAERVDGFEGPIRVNVSGLPDGFSVSSPLVVEAGHDSAIGVITATKDAPQPKAETENRTQVTAEADIDGRLLISAVNPFGKIQRSETPPKLLVFLEPVGLTPGSSNQPSRIVIQPGQTVSAKLRVERHGHDDVITFEVNNLPHGVIVDNLGLNGITFLKGENERELFLSAAKWVQPMERPFFAMANQADRPCSAPVTLKIIPRSPSQAAAR
ncbi:MAG: hypothetical protein HYR88_09830 [Verrucomicrobia bacterium]|nr:hypothetical protein [Verrucomicrobiota bacterium]MBI3868989.1 hypothetical protein [Verrucomicrobiota bacterium]